MRASAAGAGTGQAALSRAPAAAVNFLAHLYLSPPGAEGRLGSLLGDFVKGPIGSSGYEGDVARGIRLHRAIDTFTDAHPVVQSAKRLVSPHRRRHAGILVDLFFDHFLARDWHRWHEEPLADFAARTYAELATSPQPVPDRFARMLPAMASQDWLRSYERLGGIGRALDLMARRSAAGVPLAGGVAELHANLQAFEEAFERFFPDVIRLAASHGAGPAAPRLS